MRPWRLFSWRESNRALERSAILCYPNGAGDNAKTRGGKCDPWYRIERGYHEEDKAFSFSAWVFVGLFFTQAMPAYANYRRHRILAKHRR